MGMSLFFALSGFLITSALRHNSDVHAFLVRRLARIVPLAYLYVLVLLAFRQIDTDAALWTMGFAVNYAHPYLGEWNGHFWSLCVEVQFYAAIALVVLLVGPRGLLLVWPACFAITALRVGEGAHHSIVTHLRVDEILAGACVATLIGSPFWKSTRVTLALTGMTVALWFLSSHPASGAIMYLRPYCSAAFLAAVAVTDCSSVHRALSARVPRYIATISYALYVLHGVTLHGWMNTGGTLERYVFKRPISLAATFALAHLSTFYWERFWQQWGRQWRAKSAIM